MKTGIAIGIAGLALWTILALLGAFTNLVAWSSWSIQMGIIAWLFLSTATFLIGAGIGILESKKVTKSATKRKLS